MRSVFVYILELLMLIFIMMLSPLFIWIDFTILETNSSEYSLTEFTQEFLILSSSILLFIKMRKNPDSKGFLLLFAGLFMTMFIREGDFLWDQIMKGLWTILAILVLLITGFFAYQKRQSIIPAFLAYRYTRGFTYLITGLLIVLIFSRVFGTGDLWRSILKENYIGHFKTAIQEGLELLGYGFIFYGSLLMPKNPPIITPTHAKAH